MWTEEFIMMMFTVDLYGNRGLDSRNWSPAQDSDIAMIARYELAAHMHVY